MSIWDKKYTELPWYHRIYMQPADMAIHGINWIIGKLLFGVGRIIGWIIGIIDLIKSRKDK